MNKRAVSFVVLVFAIFCITGASSGQFAFDCYDLAAHFPDCKASPKGCENADLVNFYACWFECHHPTTGEWEPVVCGYAN